MKEKSKKEKRGRAYNNCYERIMTAGLLGVIAIVFDLFAYLVPGIGHNGPLFTSVGFWFLLLIEILAVVDAFVRNNSGVYNTFLGIPQIICIVLVVIFFMTIFISGPIFNAESYSNLADISTSEDLSDIPTLDEVNNISLMDTASATKLGDRQLGKMTDLVSQYEVDDCYYTISYQGKIYKIASLEYGGFFKWKNNDSIPGYVLVDPEDNTAKYVEVKGGMKYSPSAYFGENLFRYVQTQYPFTKFVESSGNTVSGATVTTYSFQLDEEGTPYWIIPTAEYTICVGYKQINGCVAVNAITGETQMYALDEIPTWMDLIYNGPILEELYDYYGTYLNGYFNFSETGETMTTDDYGYLRIDDDIYIYTGVTSVASDESNIGFIIANTRTGKITYYAVDGAEEYSAMSAAEGMVQNYGYEASFPALVMVNDQPTYAMVLKDSAGLIKKYAMVNMQNYTIVAIGDSLDEVEKAYDKKLNGSGTTSGETNADIEEDAEIDASGTYKVVTDMQFETVDADVYVVLTFEDGSTETYKVNQ